jgi:hypothetical protein
MNLMLAQIAQGDFETVFEHGSTRVFSELVIDHRSLVIGHWS